MKLARSITLFLMTALLAVAAPDREVTEIHIDGAKRKSENQLLGLMGGRLAHVRSKPASPSRADDAAFLLREVMIKDGYADVKVDWKITGRNSISLKVDEGTRLSIGKITIEGAPEGDTRRLEKLYASPAEKGRPIGAGSAPFREGDVEEGLSNIRQELNAEGYWDAEVVMRSRETDPATGEVNMEIDVKAGAVHRIGTPRIHSTDGRGVEEAREAVQRFVGRPARTAHLNAMRAAVEEIFTSSGYTDAKIQMGRVLEGDLFVAEFFIELGKRVKLNQIRVDGLVRTDPKRIAQRLKKFEGDWYNEAAMNKNVRAFLATGAFASARVETVELDDQTVDATLHFEEARAKEITAAAGFETYQGLITRFGYADRNLAGKLLGFSSGFEFSSRGVLGETKLTDPWLFGSDVAGTARVYALIYGREGYQTFNSGLDGKVTWKFGDHYALELLGGYSIVNASSDGLPSSALGETVYTHPRVRVTQSVDYRDSPVLPKSGWHVENPIELGAAVGDISTSYVRAGLTGGYYRPINRNLSLGVGGEFGMVVPSGDSGELPIDLRLFNGGARSVRSFPERELGPTSPNGYPLGGEAMWNTNLELIRKLSGSVAAVAFFDSGALARSYDSLTSAEIEMAVGMGVRLELPIGPVRLEYGYNLTRDTGEPVGTLHFAIGVAY